MTDHVSGADSVHCAVIGRVLWRLVAQLPICDAGIDCGNSNAMADH
jgi:hypothetical protein